MKKNLLALLLLLISTTFAVPGVSRAASPSGDYIALGVPNLPQAARFFQQILNCEVLSGTAINDATAEALLDCGHGTIVDLARASAAPTHAGRPRLLATHRSIALVTDNAATAARWLRAHSIRVLGPARHVMRGPEAGLTVVNFLAPWGQRLQLVSSDPQPRSPIMPLANRLTVHD